MLYNKVMYIQNKPLAASFKLFIGAAALILEWYLLSQYGTVALRLFPTWVLFGTAVYYLSSALILALSENRLVGKSICPVINGMLIISIFTLAGGATLVLVANNFQMPDSSGWVVLILSLIFLVLTLLDWLFFVKKGRWQVMMPFYGLALPVTYAATIIFTAEMLPSTAEFLYPLELFNFHDFGIWPAACLMIAACTLILIFGYILYILDFIMSGKLAKYVVLPHLKVIEVDEDGQEIVEREIPTVTSPQKPKPTEVKDLSEEKSAETKDHSVEKPETKSKAPKANTEPEKVDLSPEDKQTLNDLGDTITEAIREEISKQEIILENEDEKVTEKVETSKIEITKIEVAAPEPEDKKEKQPNNQNSKPKAKHQNSKPQNNQNKSKNHKSSSSKTVNDIKNKPNQQKPNPNNKKSQKPNRPKITRY